MKKVMRKVFFKLYYYTSCVYIPVLFLYAWKFGQLRHLTFADCRTWYKAMLKMLGEYSKKSYNYRIHQVLHAFALSEFEIVRRTAPTAPDSPIVMLAVKNDLARLKMMVEHYRSVGVEKFAFLDNNSTDGTFEWMKEQKDIDVYRTTERYQTAVKEGWMNRLVSYYGFDRWYIITDSDELAVWIGMEDHKIQELTAYARKHGFTRYKGLTLDTYANEQAFAKTEDIRADYCYIDSDSYFETDKRVGETMLPVFTGGPRQRLMGSEIPLSKYPLTYFSRGTVCPNAHYFFPHNEGLSPCCYLGILHYKFIDRDLEEYKRRAQKDSGFSKGGLHYRKYVDFIEKNQSASFMYEGSVKFTDSSVLRKVQFIKECSFDD